MEEIELTPDVALALVMAGQRRLARMVRWLAFIVTHLALAVVLIAIAWATRTTFAQVMQVARLALGSHPWVWLTACGVSLLTLWRLYAKAWQWLYRRALPKIDANELPRR